MKKREEILRFLRCRERASGLMAQAPSAVLKADIEQLTTRMRSGPRRPRPAQEEVNKAQAEIAERCKELGIPKRFAPSLALSWRGRGENVMNERRAELRKVAYTSIAAIEKEVIAAQTRKIIELEAKVVMTGMASDEAKPMLADIMNLDVLRPKIEASEIAKMLESRNRTNLYHTHRDYSPPQWMTAEERRQ